MFIDAIIHRLHLFNHNTYKLYNGGFKEIQVYIENPSADENQQVL